MDPQTIKINPGDIFLTKNPMWLGKAINAMQRVWSKDSRSMYSHAGILINDTGRTYESLWTVKSQPLFKAYAGKEILIARHQDMIPGLFMKSFAHIKKCHDGSFYPFYRLIFHLIPPLAKLSLGNVVCSELVALFLQQAGIMDYHNGATPDNIHDMVKKHRGWEIVFEGKI